jgi:hypothetical protein
MKIAWSDLSINFQHIPPEKLVEDWTWLIGDDMTPIMISSIGDMFVKNNHNNVFWLHIGSGEFEKVANTVEEFDHKLQDDEQVNEWFMIHLVDEIKNSGKELIQGKLYSYSKLPIIGGSYSADNFYLLGIAEHFSVMGDIHKQLKDLPDGTEVIIKVVE